MGELRQIRGGKDTDPDECPWCGGDHDFLRCQRVRRIEFEEGYAPHFDCVRSVEFWPEASEYGLVAELDPSFLDATEEGE